MSCETIFLFPLFILSKCWCLKAGYRQNSLATWVILLCLAPLLFSLSAFLCLAFHLGDCISKARHVNSIRTRSLLEWKETLTRACSCPRKCQNNSLGSSSWGEAVLRPSSTELITLSTEPHMPLRILRLRGSPPLSIKMPVYSEYCGTKCILL